MHEYMFDQPAKILFDHTVQLIGSFSIDDGDGDDNATDKQFDWSSEENKRAARVARNYEQISAILCKTTTWNYLIYYYDDNLVIQLYSFNSLYLIIFTGHTPIKRVH